jgi:hypothetical protein
VKVADISLQHDLTLIIPEDRVTQELRPAYYTQKVPHPEWTVGHSRWNLALELHYHEPADDSLVDSERRQGVDQLGKLKATTTSNVSWRMFQQTKI